MDCTCGACMERPCHNCIYFHYVINNEYTVMSSVQNHCTTPITVAVNWPEKWHFFLSKFTLHLYKGVC